MHALIDPFDPRYWQDEEREWRIYGDNNAQTWAVVDRDDWEYFSRWRWCWKRSNHRKVEKLYLRRAVGENLDGQRLRTFSLYLHVEIMKRSGIQPPSPFHTLVDHRNGDSMLCRKFNLRWATPRMNAKNLYGQYPTDLLEG